MDECSWTSHLYNYPSYSSPWSPQSWTWLAGDLALRPLVAAGWPAASGNCTSECFWRRSPASPDLSSFLSELPSSPPEAPSVLPGHQNCIKQSVKWILLILLLWRTVMSTEHNYFVVFCWKLSLCRRKIQYHDTFFQTDCDHLFTFTS